MYINTSDKAPLYSRHTLHASTPSLRFTSQVKPSQGVRIHGQKYTIVQSYVDDAVSKCYTVIARRKRAGFVGCAAKHTNVICLFSEDDGQTISSTLSRVSKLCAYLSKQVL